MLYQLSYVPKENSPKDLVLWRERESNKRLIESQASDFLISAPLCATPRDLGDSVVNLLENAHRRDAKGREVTQRIPILGTTMRRPLSSDAPVFSSSS